MITFAKSQVSASLSSLVDYCVTVLLVEVLKSWYVTGNAIGIAAGGITNFYLNRNFVFSKGEKTRRTQFMRYSLVWIGYLLLASGGIFLLTHYLGLNHLLSKVVVSLALAFGYNYPLQKRFVFR